MVYATLVGMSLFFLSMGIMSGTRLDQLLERRLRTWKDVAVLLLKMGEWIYDRLLGSVSFFAKQHHDITVLLIKNNYPKEMAKGVVGLKWSLSLLLIAVGLFTLSPLILLGGVFIIFLVPSWLKSRWKKRRAEMSRHVLSLAELTAVGVSAGLSPLEALQQAIKGREGHLFEEVQLAINRVRLGVRAHDAFMECAQKIEIQEMFAFLDQLVQAIETGAAGFSDSVVELVRHLRELRQSKIEEIAGKAESKLLVPLMMFFAAIIAFLLGPLSYTFMDLI